MSDNREHRKLIEVALPLDEINAACKADKDRKTGTIRNLHKWFAPMPLPAWRALLFAALVDDPADDEKRAYLLDVIKRLVVNGADAPDDTVIKEAREIIEAQFPEGVPAVMDPFCGGGSTLVEAQRLGLPTFGSDLNPVPVLIARALTQLLPKMHGQPPLRAIAAATDDLALLPREVRNNTYDGLAGLAQDVTHYAEQIRDEASRRLRPYYPSQAGETPIAWIWSRTATCPNPACGVKTVLTTSWWLSKKKGDLAWIEPRLHEGHIRLDVVVGQRKGEAPPPPKVGRGASFECLGCRQVIDEAVVRELGFSGKLDVRLIAVAADTVRGRTYRAPTFDDIQALENIPPAESFLDVSIGPASQYVGLPRYGIQTHADLYLPRQALALTTFADLVAATHERIRSDCGSRDWADAVTTLLGLAVGKLAGYLSSQVRIENGHGGSNRTVPAFARHDLPMTWDFPEINCLGDTSANWLQVVKTISRALPHAPRGSGVVVRADARNVSAESLCLVATDPPYFDAIPYADLSDYFYVWHRRALRNVHPDLYATVAAPKSGELTAFPGHHGDSREQARQYFIGGFTKTFRNLQMSSRDDLPMLVVYASKEQKGGNEEETRWSSILTAVVAADLEITGTWPIHGTGARRMRGLGANAVATYVAMVCCPRPTTAGTCSLGDFNRWLRRELKPAVHNFQAAGILPVDLAQAAIGPGMQVYSRYRAVLDQSGKPVPVEHALRLINAALSEVLDEQEGELDPYSRFAVTWWQKHHWAPAPFGEADQLARPQGISVDDLVRGGVAHYPKPGFVQVVGVAGLDREWRPETDTRPTAWEAVHHLADRLIEGGGSLEAGRLMGELGLFRDPAQALVYRLHAIAARKAWTRDQERYNALIGSWSDLLAVAATEKERPF